jgi:segregation and condensation protein B
MSDSEQLPEQNIETELPLSVKLEALLFVAAEPVPTAQLATALDVSASVVERGLNELDASLQSRGLRLQRHAGRVQLTTAPQLAELIERFLGLEATSHLSRAALETLAILESGRADGPGRPILYSTTPEFLQHFGLNSILEMPPLARPEEEESKQDELLKG